MDQPQEPQRTTPPPPAGPDIISPDTAKDPILVLILALFLGGIAYFVIGQWQKGLVSVLIGLFALVIIILASCCGGWLLAIFCIPLYFALVLDAYMQADLLRKGFQIGQWTFFNVHM